VDRDLTDDEWRQVAETTADRLGFTAGGRAVCRVTYLSGTSKRTGLLGQPPLLLRPGPASC